MFLNQPCATISIKSKELNRKHEMFLNLYYFKFSYFICLLNRKHEMFLNRIEQVKSMDLRSLTVNMKCF